MFMDKMINMRSRLNLVFLFIFGLDLYFNEFLRI